MNSDELKYYQECLYEFFDIIAASDDSTDEDKEILEKAAYLFQQAHYAAEEQGLTQDMINRLLIEYKSK